MIFNTHYRQRKKHAGSGPPIVGGEEFKIEIRIDNTFSSMSFWFNMRGTCAIDWGDGTIPDEVENVVTREVKHEYRSYGEYIVSIRGNLEIFCFSNAPPQQKENKNHLIRVLSPLPSTLVKGTDVVGRAGLDSLFLNCKKLISVPSNLFEKQRFQSVFSSCFENCESLQSIPAGLFDHCTRAVNFESCFKSCKSIQSIPAGLFDYSKSGYFFGCFCDCYSLQSIPAGLFDHCTDTANFGSCFKSCVSLQSIPAGLFDHCKEAVYADAFSECFHGCLSLQSIPAGLFAGCKNVTSFKWCFTFCRSLQSIPGDLFRGCESVTTFAYCFDTCDYSLQSVPDSLFDSCKGVTDFRYCFADCSLITSAPQLWNTHPDAIGYVCYGNCLNLPFYDEIPANWR